jgi:hypothetical protein
MPIYGLPSGMDEKLKAGKTRAFSEWIEFEARRIVGLGLKVQEEHRADYMFIQIRAALLRAQKLGRQGLRDDELMPMP